MFRIPTFLQKFLIFVNIFEKMFTKTKIFEKMFGITLFLQKFWICAKTKIFVERNFVKFSLFARIQKSIYFSTLVGSIKLFHKHDVNWPQEGSLYSMKPAHMSPLRSRPTLRVWNQEACTFPEAMQHTVHACYLASTKYVPWGPPWGHVTKMNPPWKFVWTSVHRGWYPAVWGDGGRI